MRSGEPSRFRVLPTRGEGCDATLVGQPILSLWQHGNRSLWAVLSPSFHVTWGSTAGCARAGRRGRAQINCLTHANIWGDPASERRKGGHDGTATDSRLRTMLLGPAGGAHAVRARRGLLRGPDAAAVPRAARRRRGARAAPERPGRPRGPDPRGDDPPGRTAGRGGLADPAQGSGGGRSRRPLRPHAQGEGGPGRGRGHDLRLGREALEVGARRRSARRSWRASRLWSRRPAGRARRRLPGDGDGGPARRLPGTMLE